MDGLVGTATAGFDALHASLAIAIVVLAAAVGVLFRMLMQVMTRHSERDLKTQLATTKALEAVQSTLEIIKDRLPR